MQATRQEQSERADKRRGTHHQRTRANLRQVLNPKEPAQPATSGHDETPPRKGQTTLHIRITFQKYIRILHFLVSDFPEVRQKQARKISLLPPFCPDCLELRHDWRRECRRTQGVERLKECKTQGAENKRVSCFRPFGVPDYSGAWNERMQDSKRLGIRTLGREQGAWSK